MGQLAPYVFGFSALAGIVAGGSYLVSLPLEARYDNYVEEMTEEYGGFEIVHNLDEGIDNLSEASRELTRYLVMYNFHHNPQHEDAVEYLRESQINFTEAGDDFDLSYLADETLQLGDSLEALPAGENEDFYEPVRLDIEALQGDAETVRETYFMYVPAEVIEGRETRRNALQKARDVAKWSGIIAGSALMWYGQVWWWMDDD